MHKNGWRPFWAALGAALLVLLPLVGGTVLLTRQMVRTRIQTATGFADWLAQKSLPPGSDLQ